MNFTSFCFVVLLASIPCYSSACPLGAGESTLTLTRVMRNFAKSILPADRAAKKGIASPQDVTDSELDAAVQGISIAMSCAEIVATDRSGNLYPKKSADLAGDVRERYLTLFFQRMNEFHQGLAEYRVIFTGLIAQPVMERNFESAKKQMRAVGELADRAHEDLQ